MLQIDFKFSMRSFYFVLIERRGWKMLLKWIFPKTYKKCKINKILQACDVGNHIYSFANLHTQYRWEVVLIRWKQITLKNEGTI